MRVVYMSLGATDGHGFCFVLLLIAAQHGDQRSSSQPQATMKGRTQRHGTAVQNSNRRPQELFGTLTLQ
jgi:hypothetical protein